MTLQYKHTSIACRLGSVTMACGNNLPPLLFIIFRTDYGLSYEQLGRLALLNFATMLVMAFIAAQYVDKIGFRVPAVGAHVCCTLGFLVFAAVPFLPVPAYPALATGIIIYAVGGGLLEVLVSPISDALPADESRKAANMVMLHSFYCWGSMGVIVLSSLFLMLAGNHRWQLLPLLWAALPITNIILFSKVPFAPTPPQEQLLGMRKLFAAPIFWAAIVLIICAGASELVISQWASLFAEQGLGLSKFMGDLLGPSLFALMMGIGRTIFGLFGHRVNLVRTLFIAAVLCVVFYLMSSLAPHPVFNLMGMALCGLAVSLMWPATLSLTAAKFPLGGTAMFAVMAMFGSLGCAIGPWMAGYVAELSTQGGMVQSIGSSILSGAGDSSVGLRLGILAGVIFPLAMAAAIPAFRDRKVKAL